MSAHLEERIPCVDDRGHQYVVLKLRHYTAQIVHAVLIEVPTTSECILESGPPYREVNVLEEGHVFQLVDGTVLRRVDGSEAVGAGHRAGDP
jgi:hypothetical protein